MLKFRVSYLIIAVMLLISSGSTAQMVSPYYNCGLVSGDISQVQTQIESSLKANGFEKTGSYHVANKSSMLVITFSSKDLQKTCLKVKERGVIAMNLRIGLQKVGEKVELSMVNPRYMFLGYLRDSYDQHKVVLDKIDRSVKSMMKSFTNTLKPFGGNLEESELKEYHYMTMMPYFDDPVKLETFDSFEQAIATIDKNLAAKKGQTKLVYKQSFKTLKKAVYGVALLDKEEGEANFLPIVGEKHFTAMPYEIVIEGGEVTMLHGKFRFAMYWPSLTMGTFAKIMSTPGDVEDALELLIEK